MANFSLNTTVSSSGAVMLSTIAKLFWRALATPFGGWTILFQLAATSCAVSGEPS